MRLHGTAFEAVLFDMDGTLLDSTPAVERAWASVAGRHGLDADEIIAACHGVPADVTLRRLMPDATEPEIQAEIDAHLQQECEDLDGVVALPGALELIGFLDAHGVPWAVVTSAVPRLALARMGAAGISPRLLVTPEDVARGKPDPEGFLTAARLVGVPAERCVAVEDSAPGLAAARASGAIVVNVGAGGTTLTDVLGALKP